jgi:hypothetical protein
VLGVASLADFGGCHGADGNGNPGMIKALGEKGLNIVTKETSSSRTKSF